MSAVVQGVSALFNGERLAIALLGAMLVVYGSNGMMDSSLSADEKQMATLAFSGGWLVLAVSMTYLHSQHPKGYVEVLSGKSLLAFASALAIITGTSMAHAEGSHASQQARMLTVGGWAGLAFAVAARTLSPLKMATELKIFLAGAGFFIGLVGLHAKRPFGGLIPVDEDAEWPHGLHYAGAILLAIAIGMH